jgi:hypothetical protein
MMQQRLADRLRGTAVSAVPSVISRSELRPRDKAVLLAIWHLRSWRRNKGGARARECDVLAAAGVSRATLYRARAALVEAGLIAVVGVPGEVHNVVLPWFDGAPPPVEGSQFETVKDHVDSGAVGAIEALTSSPPPRARAPARAPATTPIREALYDLGFTGAACVRIEREQDPQTVWEAISWARERANANPARYVLACLARWAEWPTALMRERERERGRRGAAVGQRAAVEAYNAQHTGAEWRAIQVDGLRACRAILGASGRCADAAGEGGIGDEVCGPTSAQ